VAPERQARNGACDSSKCEPMVGAPLTVQTAKTDRSVIKSFALYLASHSPIAFMAHAPRQMVTAVVIKNSDGVMS
jgi:hypothetical protein